MLMRVRGGVAGIKGYLEGGQKEDRDTLDERVTLAGDIDFMDTVLNNMRKDGEQYLHITLSFREDHLPRETLQAITHDVEQFVFSAYDRDEYHCYAEAHLPRIKNHLDQQTGTAIARKPHIHLVIPEHNLLTDKPLNPLGRVQHQTPFLEAFQEHINAHYGLASPKDHPRRAITDRSSLLSRIKGDDFQGPHRTLKEDILAAVVERQITDYEQFKHVVAEFGSVKTRNAGKANEYLNVKPKDAKRGVNLKETSFSKASIEQPLVEKQTPKAVTDADSEPGSPTATTAATLTARLDEWHRVRAREIKYLNSGHRKKYAAYRAADPVEQRATLDELERQFYHRHRDETTLEPEREREAGKPVEQHHADLDKQHAQAEGETVPSMAEIKQKLNARPLLAATSHRHGVDPDQYEITQGRDGGDRIRCGSRNHNVTDFLTKELHLAWADAKPILETTYAAQLDAEVVPIRRAPRQTLWTDYRRQWQPLTATRLDSEPVR